MNIGEMLQKRFPDAVPSVDYKWEDEGNGDGPKLTLWNISNIPKPDLSTLNHWMSEALQPNGVDVQNERKRRLAFGFSYDFGDARGVHQIGTTPADMEGWRDVIDYANALIDSGDTTTQITIVTDTGSTAVTAPEWQAIILVAASVRQNIWAKSFALQAMQPIPGDYADDKYWS